MRCCRRSSECQYHFLFRPLRGSRGASLRPCCLSLPCEEVSMRETHFDASSEYQKLFLCFHLVTTVLDAPKRLVDPFELIIRQRVPSASKLQVFAYRSPLHCLQRRGSTRSSCHPPRAWSLRESAYFTLNVSSSSSIHCTLSRVVHFSIVVNWNKTAR